MFFLDPIALLCRLRLLTRFIETCLLLLHKMRMILPKLYLFIEPYIDSL